MKILIADDSEQIRERLSRLLSRLPDSEIVGEAVDGVDAVKQTIALNPDVLVLDIKMPGKTGIDVIKRLRPEMTSLMIVVLTNFASEQVKNESLKAGADFVFDKSNEFDEVSKVIDNTSTRIGR